MTDARLFDIDEVPEVPLFREPRRGKGAQIMDGRLDHDYPPEWDKCTTCDGLGKAVVFAWGWGPGERNVPLSSSLVRCADCLGMGSVKARVRLEAGHRCVRCSHPYVPKGDAKMLGVEPSGMHDCATCDGDGRFGRAPYEGAKYDALGFFCTDCKGAGRVWTPWSACDEKCTHGAPIRWRIKGQETWQEIPRERATVAEFLDVENCEVEAKWRILTVHHLTGDKADCRWGNLVALCQVCHLHIQHKVVMERVYPHEHSEWFKPHAAWWYALNYLGEALSREQVMERLDELLALERSA